MSGRTVLLTIAGATGLLLAPRAIAWACSCAVWVSEERYFAVASITQIDGPGDHLDAERARWGGKTRMTLDSSPDAATVELWLRVHADDGPVRNVRIESTADVVEDTGDTDEPGGAR